VTALDDAYTQLADIGIQRLENHANGHDGGERDAQ
jgi:uncharacterized protein YjiS (DUF1127 family)